MVYQNKYMSISLTKKESLIVVITMVQLSLILFLGNSVLGYPTYEFLVGAERFDDFFNTILRADKLPDAQSSYIVGPALILLFRHISVEYGNYVFIFYNVLCIALIYFALRRLRIGKWIALALIASYPVLFAISRGNAELLVFAIVLLSISYFIVNEFKTALTLMMLAIIIKPTALIFLMIYPLKMLFQYWKILMAAFLANLLIIISINLNALDFVRVYLIMLENYKVSYIYGMMGDLFNNSLYGLLKTGAYLFTQGDTDGRSALIKSMSDSYGIISNLVLFTCVLFVQFVKGISLSTKVWFLAAAIVFLPHVSADYRLLYLLIPISLILINGERNHFLDKIIFYGTLLLLVPKHFVVYLPLRHDWVVFNASPATSNVITSQTIINPILFLGMLCLILIRLRIQWLSPKSRCELNS